ncbi:MAG: PD40 domain-containing protein [Acidobacteriaceae bacterium]|nr:PD40 domain-containing protein [Acidobacteriaceae bacterium]MBV8572959.1 PD40 domain-containing protein [Acidobacteriaceae bacterium]
MSGRGFGPAWSPDGRFLAYLRYVRGGTAILVTPAVGGQERELTASSVLPVGCPTGGAYQHPSWHGRRIASGSSRWIRTWQVNRSRI